MDSGKYEFDTDFNSLFASESKPGNEILLYRTYSASLSVRHMDASYSNLYEGNSSYGNLSTLKAWLCADGQPYTPSTLENADSFDMKDIIKTRDSRMEASFWGETNNVQDATGIYCTKFCFREGPILWETATNSSHPHFKSNTNTNGAPCVRYAETVLNWIEAKAELADGTILEYECEVDENNKIVKDNRAKMKGFKIPRNIVDRGPIGGEKQYLEPICTDVLAQYKDNGYDGIMTQNPGWEGI